ncbi:hypothetical protein [Chrysiogenes arsenatis]|uniref:hypothetical protein n=1 Tax=Chrysiogenes arsenatis TaxID=309797 RepID=UPI00040D2EBE|nr:hypothetical protein [Chrysiogenes arsenatis]
MRTNIFILLFVLLLSTTSSLAAVIDIFPLIPATSSLTTEEKQRIADTIRQQIRTANEAVPSEDRIAFWNTVERLTPNDRTQLRDLILRSEIALLENFYRDALSTLQQGGATKSVARERLEQELIDQRLLSLWRRDEMDESMRRIAAGEPVRFDVFPAAVTVEQIQQRLKDLTNARRYVGMLFLRPAQLTNQPDNALIPANMTLSPFTITLQGRSGSVEGTISIDLRLATRDRAQGRQEILNKKDAIEQTVRNIAFHWRAANLDGAPDGQNRFAREIARDLGYILAVARLEAVTITALDILGE